jgi:hypothetical protein
MSLTPATVLGARKAPEIDGQLDLFGPEADEPDTTTEEPTDSTNAERTAA